MALPLAILSSLVLLAGACRAAPAPWVGIWAAAPIEEAPAPELLAAPGLVLRQVVRISTGAETVRLRLSNEYGSEPLVLDDVRLAVAAAGGAIRDQTDRPVRFGGSAKVTVPPRSVCVSDPLAFAAAAHTDLAVTARLLSLPRKLAGHPGSRATSYLKPGACPADGSLAGAARIVHWYFLSAIEAEAGGAGRAAVVCLGDSLTDGHGCETDSNTRWTDDLSRRLKGNPATERISVLNLGIGGNRLLHPGLGPAGLARLPRDVFAQAGVKWVILQLGVNDLGTRVKAREAGQSFASAQDIIAGYRQAISECRGRGIRVALATLTPFAGAGWYSTPDIEADRQAINRWIRNEAPCDRVLDFDAALRDPAQPTLLLGAYDSGDHLHPSAAGYQLMAETVPLDFFGAAHAGASWAERAPPSQSNPTPP
jgi:lysophospholipase L1-like esterase